MMDIIISYPTSASGIGPQDIRQIFSTLFAEKKPDVYNVRVIFKCVNCLILHCFAFTKPDA